MKISDVSELSGLTMNMLRYYEEIGLFPPVNRTNGGIRDYSERDMKRVDFIKCMWTGKLPIEG